LSKELERLKQERERLEAEKRLLEKEKQKLAYIPKTVKSERVSLRAEPQPAISEKYVKNMVERYNFFDNNWNRFGSFENDFVDNNDGTVTDRATGLMWQKSGSSRSKDWRGAKSYVKELNSNKFAEYSNWRLPTIDELASLLKEKKNHGLHIDPVFSGVQTRVWSADYYEHKQRTQASSWVVDFSSGGTREATFCILVNCGPPYSIYNVIFPENHVKAVRKVK